MTEVPEISVIMPVFNRAKYLRVAIQSVLAQSFTAWELLIVDDGSDDPETISIVSNYDDPRIRVLRLEHTGRPAAVRNAGMLEARGEYLAFLDSDDVWQPEKLTVQMASVRARPECAWIYSAVDRIGEDGALIANEGIQQWRPHSDNMVERLLRIEALVATPTVLIRRDVAEALGGFDIALEYAEDYDLWTRAATCGEVLVIESPLAQVRVHDDNYSRDRLGVHRSWMQVYEKFSRAGPDKKTRRVARQRRTASALTVASILAGLRENRAEARRIVREFAWPLLLQPNLWPTATKLLIRLKFE